MGLNMNKNKFVGTWEPVSFEIRLPDGNVINPYGDNPTGNHLYMPREGYDGRTIGSYR